MKYTAENPPQCYFSFGIDEGIGYWCVYWQGQPICNYKRTRAEAEAAARQMKVKPAAIWHAGAFQPLTEEPTA